MRASVGGTRGGAAGGLTGINPAMHLGDTGGPLTSGAAGAADAASSEQGTGYVANPGAGTMTTADPRRIETDVLVIGGGMAGAFAALTAQAQGLVVTLVDKGTVGRSGSTPWANGSSVP